MLPYKNFILLLLLVLIINTTYSQQRKFPTPAYADTITNPLKGDVSSIPEGKRIYTRFCVTCHGNKGKGDGIAAPGLAKPPADHTSDFVQKQKDGALYWIITEGNRPMPTYKTTLTPIQRWEVVNYIRTLAKEKKS
jgi:mono/diheme cytochrome c family protein